jgi:hypothetical protein
MATTKLKSNFRAAIKASDEAVADAIRKGTEAMEAEAAKRISRAADQRGYELTTADLEMTVTSKQGTLAHKQWWWRFFEFGTVYITPVSALGPGHRKGRKVLKDTLDDDFEKWIRRKAGM